MFILLDIIPKYTYLVLKPTFPGMTHKILKYNVIQSIRRVFTTFKEDGTVIALVMGSITKSRRQYKYKVGKGYWGKSFSQF